MNKYQKPLIQGLILIGSLFLIWFLFQLINWSPLVAHKKVDLVSEKKIGDLLLEGIKQSEHVSEDAAVFGQLDSLVGVICTSNGINRANVQLHLIDKNEVNAFAMPGGHLIVYTGLFKKTENSDQLCAVLAHEIAHIQLNHVIEKLSAEIGLTVLFSVLTNGGDAHMIHEILRNLSSTKFSRELEKEADLKAIVYLQKSRINPLALADFMEIMARDEDVLSTNFEWFSSHPSSKNRVSYLRKEAKKYQSKPYVLALPAEHWKMLQQRL